LQRVEGLHNPRFHVEDARAVCFARAGVKGHFGQRTEGINGVIVAEHEELASRTGRTCRPDNPNMIAAMFLRDYGDRGFAAEPFSNQKTGASVSGPLVQTGRLDFDEFPEC